MVVISNCINVHIAYHLTTYFLDRSTRRNQIKEEVLLGTLFHAHLSRRAAIERRCEIHAFRQIQEDQIRFINHTAVRPTFAILRISGQNQPLRVTVLIGVARYCSPCSDKGDKQDQAEDVCAGASLAGSLKMWIEFERLTCFVARNKHKLITR